MGDRLAGSLKSATVDANGWRDSNADGGTTGGKYYDSACPTPNILT